MRFFSTSKITSCFSFFVFFFIMTSCDSTNEEIEMKELNNPFDSQLYLNSKYSTQKRISILCSELSNLEGKSVRSNLPAFSPDELVEWLINMPTDTIHKSYNPNYELEKEKAEDNMMEYIAQATSEENAIELLIFIDKYIRMGGHEEGCLVNAMSGQPYLIQECMIVSAAAIDEVMTVTNLERASNSYCIEQLVIELAHDFVDDAIKDTLIDILSVFPGVDVLAELAIVGMDFHDALKLAFEYERCTASHIN